MTARSVSKARRDKILTGRLLSENMPRPANPEVRKRLLAEGLDLIHARGFAASGVKDITEAAGVPKGSFYAYFPSKEGFASAILDADWVDIETRPRADPSRRRVSASSGSRASSMRWLTTTRPPTSCWLLDRQPVA